MYDRAIYFLKQAQEKIIDRDYYQRNQLILKAQNIILELMNSLNFEAGKIAYSLQSLYNYMIRRLIIADQSSKQQIIQEVISMLSELNEAWENISYKADTTQGEKVGQKVAEALA